jgi:hypothetical protein
VSTTVANNAGSEMTDLLADAPLYVRFVHEHSQWYAKATEYEVVGIGRSRTEASEAMLRSLKTYLRYEQRRGRDARQARRTTGRLATLKVRLLVVLSRPLPHRRRLALRMRLSG